METSRNDFAIAIRSAFLKKGTQQRFSLLGLIFFSIIFLILGSLNFKAINNKGREVDIGSICSGGQYNKLISRFKGVDIPGTGMSIGVDRLLFVMLQLDQIIVDLSLIHI